MVSSIKDKFQWLKSDYKDWKSSKLLSLRNKRHEVIQKSYPHHVQSVTDPNAPNWPYEITKDIGGTSLCLAISGIISDISARINSRSRTHELLQLSAG